MDSAPRTSTGQTRRPEFTVTSRALFVLLLVLVAAGCVTQPAARLRFAGDDPQLKAGASVGLVAYDSPYSFGSLTICLTSPSTATMTDVSLHDVQGDGRIEAFAVRPRPPTTTEPFLGAEPISLSEFGSGFQPGAAQTVTGSCRTPVASDGNAGDIFELAVQLAWSSGDVTSGTALDVTYVIDGATVTSQIPFAIALCRDICPEDPWSPEPGPTASP